MKHPRQASSPRPEGLRQSSSLTPVAEALARLTAPLRPVAAEPLPLEAAVGRVLAEPIRAHGAVPPHAVALRDGWAVTASETVGASTYTPVMLPEEPRFVTIGAALPAGADAVLPPDAVSTEAGFAEVAAPAAPGEAARRAGEDVVAGTILRATGERVRVVDTAVARGAGVGVCSVRRARVRVIGDGAASTLIARLAKAAGATVACGRVEDGGFASDADLVAVIGTPDPAAVLSQADMVIAPALALRPGEGLRCALTGTVPVLIVPDRLEAALAAALVLMRPCLDRLMTVASKPSVVTAPLARKLPSSVGLTEIALLRETNGSLEPLAIGDITLSAMAWAETWLIVPPDSEGFVAGEVVQAYVL
jgi:molybdopterin biosynthesis enzyme